MNFKNFKFSNFISIVIIVLIYPLIKRTISPANKMLVFCDALFIESFVLIIFGMIYYQYQKGNFVNTFRIMDKLSGKKVTDKKFYADDQEKRENSFNYPLFVGLLALVINIIISCLFF